MDIADPQKCVSAFQCAYEGYQFVRTSDWGFPIVSSIALFCVLLLVMQAATHIPVTKLVGDTFFHRMFRKYKGKELARKERKRQEDMLVADIIVDAFDNAILADKLPRKRVQMYLARIGAALRNYELIPTSKAKEEKRIKSKMNKLKFDLKRKHGSKVVDLTKAREEQAKKSMTLTQKLLLAKKSKSA